MCVYIYIYIYIYIGARGQLPRRCHYAMRGTASTSDSNSIRTSINVLGLSYEYVGDVSGMVRV